MKTLVPAPAFQSPFDVGGYDGWIMLGYVAFSIILLAAIYLASGGPSVSDAGLAAMVAMP